MTKLENDTIKRHQRLLSVGMGFVKTTLAVEFGMMLWGALSRVTYLNKDLDLRDSPIGAQGYDLAETFAGFGFLYLLLMSFIGPIFLVIFAVWTTQKEVRGNASFYLASLAAVIFWGFGIISAVHYMY